LRSYLGLGGWVGDHAVIDRDLDTLHVFTCVEVDRIPPARAASLRALSGHGLSGHGLSGEGPPSAQRSDA
jgi:hypothetical protein